MRILFLGQVIPFPPDAGPKVKTWNVLNYLVERGHQVTLAAFVRPEEQAYVPKVREVCSQVYTVPIRRSKVKDILYFLRSILTSRPFLIERDDLTEMRQLVKRLLSAEQYDIIHCDQLSMAQFAFPGRFLGAGAPVDSGNSTPGPIRVFDAHNAVWTIIERMRLGASWLMRPVFTLEARRIKRYEGMLVSHFECTLAVTEPDRLNLQQAVAFYSGSNGKVAVPVNELNIHVFPIAVDTAILQPVERSKGSTNILTLGTLLYPPNADGLRWFLREVFPLILQQKPDVSLTIIGKSPPEDLVKLASAYPQKVTLTGYVPDLKPYMRESGLIVIPLRAGSGMRVRILEALAQGMPLVTTTIGLEGIDARHGEEVMVADDPVEFSSAVVSLMEDEALQARLAENGRKLAVKQYDWRIALQKMDEAYRSTDRKVI